MSSVLPATKLESRDYSLDEEHHTVLWPWVALSDLGGWLDRYAKVLIQKQLVLTAQ